MDKQKKRRVSVTEEEVHWICIGLKSVSKAGRTGARRGSWLVELAERLEEGGRGNPYLKLYGRTHMVAVE